MKEIIHDQFKILAKLQKIHGPFYLENQEMGVKLHCSIILQQNEMLMDLIEENKALHEKLKHNQSEVKGFISWNGWRGEESLPVSKIITIGIEPYTYCKNGKDIKRWHVKCELDVYNPAQKDFAWGYETEAEAREFYNYCLKQIAEWQDEGEK